MKLPLLAPGSCSVLNQSPHSLQRPQRAWCTRTGRLYQPWAWGGVVAQIPVHTLLLQRTVLV